MVDDDDDWCPLPLGQQLAQAERLCHRAGVVFLGTWEQAPQRIEHHQARTVVGYRLLDLLEVADQVSANGVVDRQPLRIDRKQLHTPVCLPLAVLGVDVNRLGAGAAQPAYMTPRPETRRRPVRDTASSCRARCSVEHDDLSDGSQRPDHPRNPRQLCGDHSLEVVAAKA